MTTWYLVENEWTDRGERTADGVAVKVESHLDDSRLGRGTRQKGLGAFFGEVSANFQQVGSDDQRWVVGFGPASAELYLPRSYVRPFRLDSTFRPYAVALPPLVVAEFALRRGYVHEGGRAIVVGEGTFAEIIALVAARHDSASGPLSESCLGEFLSQQREPLCVVYVQHANRPTRLPELLAMAPPKTRIVLVGSSMPQTFDVDFYATVHKRCLQVIGIPDDPFTICGQLAPLVDESLEQAKRFLTTRTARISQLVSYAESPAVQRA